MNPSAPSRRHFLAAAGLTAAGLTAAGLPARADEPPPLAPPDKQPPDLKLPDPPAKPLGWAVVGLGKLALEEVMPAFRLCKLSRPTALVSGHLPFGPRLPRLRLRLRRPLPLLLPGLRQQPQGRLGGE